jgi:hypothetical protein
LQFVPELAEIFSRWTVGCQPRFLLYPAPRIRVRFEIARESGVSGLLDHRNSSHARALVLLFAAMLCPLSARALPIMHIDVDSQGSTATVVIGASFSVALLASEIPAGDDGRGLFGFGFLLTLDSTAFSAGTPVVDVQWTPLATSTSSGPGFAGATSSRFDRDDGPVGDDIPLASVAFTALQEGVYGLQLTHFIGEGDNLLFDGTVLDEDGSGFFGTGSITVIPEPATALLLAAGLAPLALVRRRF